MKNRQYYAGQPWTCPSCSRQLRIARWYSLLIFGISMVLAAIGCVLVGLRGLWLFGGVVVFIPVSLACVILLDYTVPVPLEIDRSKNSSESFPP